MELLWMDQYILDAARNWAEYMMVPWRGEDG
jgi:hypothetical protein